ncbi:MAG: hypothetical protein DRP42_03675 [Tenericutes bacterium]|nr:MAG: hypothetical protein DRP42_03675 [Mycoplasmatota bacterium]
MSLRGAFYRGLKSGARTPAQDAAREEKKRKAARKRALASEKRREEGANLRVKRDIESEKTRRAEVKLFSRRN